MKIHNVAFFVAPLLLGLVFAARAGAQQTVAPTPQQTPAPSVASPPEQTQQSRADQLEMIRSLNLTEIQRARIAQIRQETEEQARLVNVRLRRARRALDQAIYSEQADEAVIQQRTKDVAEAEAARVQMRADAELKVRRVLTPEQFATFRELRRQAQITRQHALRDNDAALPRQGRERAQSRNNTDAAAPTLFPRRQRPNAPNHRTPARP